MTLIDGGFRVLLVEDNPDSLFFAREALNTHLPGCEITEVRHRDGAFDALSDQEYDLAVCDLKIPIRENTTRTSEDNGFEVVSQLESHHAGTPVIILSAWASIENTENRTSSALVVPAYGVAQLRMCQVAEKGRTDDFEMRLDVIFEGLRQLSEIDVVAPDDVDPILLRAVRFMAQLKSYKKVELTSAGGLSGSINAFARFSGPGRPELRTFVKLDDHEWITEEARRKSDFVEGHLDPGLWAPTIASFRTGLRDRAVSFSSLAATSYSSLFEAIGAGPDAGARLVSVLASGLEPWLLDESPTTLSLGDLRRRHLSDEQAEALGLDLAQFADIEALDVPLSQHVTHGDLHGENVLVVPTERPLLIDFAYSEVGPGCLDPITLEMSLLFHPDSPLQPEDLETVRYEDWSSGNYGLPSEYEAFAARCREWSLDRDQVRGVVATAYAHALRQAKHPNVLPARALGVARGLAETLRT